MRCAEILTHRKGSCEKDKGPSSEVSLKQLQHDSEQEVTKTEPSTQQFTSTKGRLCFLCSFVCYAGRFLHETWRMGGGRTH